MGKIINSEVFRTAMIDLNDFFRKKKYSKLEIRLIIDEYTKTLEVFEKLDQGKALRETILEIRKLQNDET